MHIVTAAPKHLTLRNVPASVMRAQYPLATVRTVADALRARQEQVDLVRKLLEEIGRAHV